MVEDQAGASTRHVAMDLTALRRRLGPAPLSVAQVNHLVTATFPLMVALVGFERFDSAGGIALAAGLAQTVALTWARRFPAAMMLVIIAMEAALFWVSHSVLTFGVIIAAYYAASWGDRRQRIVALSAGLGYCAVAVALTTISNIRTLPMAGAMVMCFLGFWISGRFEASQRSRISELRETSSRLAEERAVAEQRAADRERALLARELHDILNHSVTRMVLDAEAGAETGDEAAARQTLYRVADTGRDSLAELRRLLGVLRTETPDELRPPPDLNQLDELVDRIPSSGPQVTVDRQGEVRPADTSIELAAYRVVQESLTNVAKHAGAVPTNVRLTYLTGALEIEVVNELPRDRRQTRAVRGTGLVGLRERVELLGGTLHAGPTKTGFAVYATLPLRQPVRSGGGS
ncbi:sensor histidine kinase [Kribbella sp. NPDC056345]|uniref:sensor histidine kinase n=1 Tax=Kribbella sp. NPDC056345 TaxID=3345789 RepID=UPI0035DF3CD2